MFCDLCCTESGLLSVQRQSHVQERIKEAQEARPIELHLF